MTLDWTGQYWCSLHAEDERSIKLEFWRKAAYLCARCGTLAAAHHGRAMGCQTFLSPLVTNLMTEVRFRGLVQIQKGNRTRHGFWRGPNARATTSLVRLHAMPLGALLEVARLGLPLELMPTRAKYKNGAAMLPATELSALAVAVDMALEREEWAVPDGFRPGLPPASAQRDFELRTK